MDWIYTPILVLYTNQLQNKINAEEAQQIFTVRNCLRWILIYETYFPFLASGINPTDKFCRLACVFLGSDNLFLTTEIHDLIELCFNSIIEKFENKLNFKKEIQGEMFIVKREICREILYGAINKSCPRKSYKIETAGLPPLRKIWVVSEIHNNPLKVMEYEIPCFFCFQK